MLITEKQIREIIRKNLIKESAPDSEKKENHVYVIDGSFDIEKMNVINGKYQTFLKKFLEILDKKKIKEFQNDIIKIFINESNFIDNDQVIDSLEHNVKKLDKTSTPWTANNAQELVDKLNRITDKSDLVIKKLYNLARPMTRTGGWGAGKGEILSVLLSAPDYRSGGTREKDLYRGPNDFIEIKQVESKNTKINIPIEAFPDKKIAKDFEENLRNIKGTIDIFKQVLEKEFIESGSLRSSNWNKVFFNKSKDRFVMKKLTSKSDILNADEESSMSQDVGNDDTNLYGILAKFIFDDFKKNKYISSALFDFNNNDVTKRLENIENIDKGEIFPIYDSNFSIPSWTSDISESIKNTYDLIKDASGEIDLDKKVITNIFKEKNVGTRNKEFQKQLSSATSDEEKDAIEKQIEDFNKKPIKKTSAEHFEILKEFEKNKSNFKINDNWLTEFKQFFENYFEKKLNIIKNPDLINVSVNSFSKTAFDTLFDDILLGSIDKIESKMSNSPITDDDKENISITLDDGKNEIELFTTINNFKIIEPAEFNLNGSIKNINNNVKKIGMENISFADEEMKKKLQNRKYKNFFAVNENKTREKKFIFETDIVDENISKFSHENYSLINDKRYLEIDSYKAPSQMKDKPLLEKVDNLISNLICLEKSIAKYYDPGIIIFNEASGTFDSARVLCGKSSSGSINKISDRIEAGKGVVDTFDQAKMKIETKFLFADIDEEGSECILKKLLAVREKMKAKILSIQDTINSKTVNQKTK